MINILTSLSTRTICQLNLMVTLFHFREVLSSKLFVKLHHTMTLKTFLPLSFTMSTQIIVVNIPQTIILLSANILSWRSILFRSQRNYKIRTWSYFIRIILPEFNLPNIKWDYSYLHTTIAKIQLKANKLFLPNTFLR